MSDLRKDFFSELLKLAKKDKKIILLVCDLGFSFKEQFEKELPEQILNVGCAEQNAVGMAAGMASKGMRPFVYSNALFLTSRANEQIRDDVCYNKEDVKLCGTGASGFLGFSHNCSPEDEDIRLLSTFPNIKLFKPNNVKELRQALKHKGSAYIRL
jgi:transketolase